MMMIIVKINLLAADCRKKSRLTVHGWFEFVLASLPYSFKFFRDTPPPPVYPSTQNPTLKNSSLIRGVQTLFEAAFKSPLMYVDILYSVNHSILTDIDVIVIFFNLESWLQTSVRIFIRGCPSILCSLR